MGLIRCIAKSRISSSVLACRTYVTRISYPSVGVLVYSVQNWQRGERSCIVKHLGVRAMQGDIRLFCIKNRQMSIPCTRNWSLLFVCKLMMAQGKHSSVHHGI